MATLAGQTLGKYQIIERLGRGGMAEVYKAHHPTLDRYAAIKVLHHFLAEGQDFTARFQREAKAIAALRHPNIVQVYDFEIQPDLYYMIMEFVDGGTLKDRLLQASNPLPYAEIVHITREVAAALEYAHQRGVLHRDIKPANVLLSKNGRVVLTDFGIARILSETQFTATGTLVGTPAYMSPEQGMGQKVENSSDLYSLGIILYEMVTGKVPFASDTPLAVIHKHINEPLPKPSTLRPDIPPRLEAVIETTLQKDPADRYSSVGEFKNALDAALEEMPASQRDAPRPPAGISPSMSQPSPEVYDKATVAMTPEEEPVPQETITSRPTVAMEAEEPKGSEEPAKPSDQLTKRPIRPTDQPTNPTKRIIGLIAALIVIGALIFGGIQLFGNAPISSGCDSIESCQMQAEELFGQGNPIAALEAVDAALRYADSEPHPPHAHLWCLRGEILIGLEEFDEARWSFEDCIAWTEDDPDPGLDELRFFAQEQIDMLNSR